MPHPKESSVAFPKHSAASESLPKLVLNIPKRGPSTSQRFMCGMRNATSQRAAGKNMRWRENRTGMKCDLAAVAKQMIDIVGGKSSASWPARRIKSSDPSLMNNKDTASVKRKSSLLVQIEAATGGSETSEPKSARKQTDDRRLPKSGATKTTVRRFPLIKDFFRRLLFNNRVNTKSDCSNCG
jgi:hypothetical protein